MRLVWCVIEMRLQVNGYGRHCWPRGSSAALRGRGRQPMSASGSAQADVRFTPKKRTFCAQAYVRFGSWHVRFTPESGHWRGSGKLSAWADARNSAATSASRTAVSSISIHQPAMVSPLPGCTAGKGPGLPVLPRLNCASPQGCPTVNSAVEPGRAPGETQQYPPT